MIKQNRWLCLFLAFLLFAGPALPAQAAEADFASFLIDGDEMDFPQRPLHIQLYQRDQTGTFVPSDQVVLIAPQGTPPFISSSMLTGYR